MSDSRAVDSEYDGQRDFAESLKVGYAAIRERVANGRPSKWGNPFVIGKDGTRDQVVEKFREWVVLQPNLMAALGELKGRDLVCWCAPAKCHADVLIELANRGEVK